MKIKSKLLFVLAALFICCGTLKAQRLNTWYSVYWFSVSIKINSEREIEILDSASNVIHGSLKDFSKAVKKGVVQHQIMVGPFHTEKEAKNARIYYKKSQSEISVLDNQGKMCWFQCAVIKKGKDSYNFTRSPAAVSTGSATEFTKDLYEGIIYQKFTIGPFGDYIHAEETKSIYRKAEVNSKKIY